MTFLFIPVPRDTKSHIWEQAPCEMQTCGEMVALTPSQGGAQHSTGNVGTFHGFLTMDVRGEEALPSQKVIYSESVKYRNRGVGGWGVRMEDSFFHNEETQALDMAVIFVDIILRVLLRSA